MSSEPIDTIIIGESPGSERSRLWTFIVFIAVSLIVGFTAKEYHSRYLDSAVYTVPILTGISHDVTNDTYQLDYRVSAVGGRTCLDIGGLRVVAPENVRSYSTSTGSIRLAKNTSGGSSTGDVEISTDGFKMNVQFGGYHFSADRTIATIDGTEIDMAKGKTVVVMTRSGKVEGIREIEAGP